MNILSVLLLSPPFEYESEEPPDIPGAEWICSPVRPHWNVSNRATWIAGPDRAHWSVDEEHI